MTKLYTQIHTGPVNVHAVADRLDAAGYPVEVRGTEHVYLWLPVLEAGWGILPAIEQVKQTTGLDLRGVVLRDEDGQPYSR